MKYTKKQLVKAYSKLATNARLNPSEFMSSEECDERDVKKHAKSCVKTLLSYM